MISALNGSSVYRFECSNVVEIRNRVMFDFLPETATYVLYCTSFHRIQQNITRVWWVYFEARVKYLPHACNISHRN